MKTRAKLFALIASGIGNRGLDGDIPTIMHLDELAKNVELIICAVVVFGTCSTRNEILLSSFHFPFFANI